jgi:hypothetical protein
MLVQQFEGLLWIEWQCEPPGEFFSLNFPFGALLCWALFPHF